LADSHALAPALCAGCGTELAPTALVCPICHRLVHGQTLRRLATAAEQATQAGDAARAIESWRRAFELLPDGSKQRAQIAERIEGLTSAADTEGKASTKSQSLSIGSKLAGLGAIGLLVWKLKSVLLFVATKAKLLLMGFTKAGTLLSMFASLGLYASLWGWKFGLGLVLSIYVHEIGHVAALRRLGIAATAPMFIPGLGAFVRLKQYPATPREDAEVGLAGPAWGLGAAIAAWGLGTLTAIPLLVAIARVGAWINLFNLLPLGPLDGGRGFRALAKQQRWLACAAIGAGVVLSGDGLLLLLLAVAVLRTLTSEAPAQPDRRALASYSVLVVALSLLCGSSVALP
jgi:Zn-dependent protease